MAITPESILFGSQFFRWCQDNGETIVVQHETVLIEEGRITPNLYLVLEGSGQVRTTRESEDEGTSSIELAVIGAGNLLAKCHYWKTGCRWQRSSRYQIATGSVSTTSGWSQPWQKTNS